MTDHDDESKTEDPTERRLQDAVDKGNVPFSQEAVTLGSLLAILIALKVGTESLLVHTVQALHRLVENAGSIRLEVSEDSIAMLAGVAAEVSASVLPVLALVAAGGIVAALAQNVPQAATERVKPKSSRISPLAGWKRIYGTQGLVEFGKTAVKLAAILTVLVFVLKAELPRIQRVFHSDPTDLPQLIVDSLTAIVTALCAVALALTIFDVTWSRYSWRKSLRMTREELKEEFRQSEGDPHFKARARSIARQRVSKKMFQKLPTATMVITNPTHYAVALRYQREEDGAPRVVAKGLDHLALRIREAAGEHGIPLVENRPLARSLYDSVGIDEAIPPELYRAVAEIIHFLHMRGRYVSAGRRP